MLIYINSHMLNAGFWDTESFRKELSDVLQVDLSPQDAVAEAGNKCYSGIRASFANSGYWKVLFAYGDHEAGT